MSKRNVFFFLLLAAIFIIAATIPTKSLSSNGNNDPPLIAGRNVNMVAGQELPDGDPFLQRQNEPSIAVSTRNPLHLLAGANDYRSVGFAQSEGELPGQEPGTQLNSGDAWLGVFKSFNGGQSWISTLLPGCQYYDTTPIGAPPSDLLGLGAAADPTVRAGANGMFYYSGIAFDRIEHGRSVLFVSRFIDNNTTLIGDTDPIKYIDTTIIDEGTSGQFADKPWIAVDIPRNSFNQSSIQGLDIPDQSIPAHNVYIAYSIFLGSIANLNVHNKILFARSTDCGNSWGQPIKLSEGEQVNQGTIVAVSPLDGTVYVAWRRFASGNVPGAILICKSEDFGYRFNKPVEVTLLPPAPEGAFDQGTTGFSFRTSALPALAVDHNGTIYVAWSERLQDSDGESRIMIKTSTDGINWSEAEPINAPENKAHQIMPSLTYAAGKLMMTWYDTRKSVGGYEFDIADPGVDGESRHTLDVWAAQADPIDPLSWSSTTNPSFTFSTQVSRYLYWAQLNPDGTIKDPLVIEQVEHNPPNYPMFKGGDVPFHGDYIDITPSPLFLPDPYSDGGWRFNTGYTGVIGEEWKKLDPDNFHVTWTDNRDVRPPKEGLDWTDYSHPGDGCLGQLTTGMRDQNVYTSQLTHGVIVGSPVNTKPLVAPSLTESNGVQKRTFLVFIKNLTDLEKYFKLTMETPEGMQASFWEEWPLEEDEECPLIYCDNAEVWVPVSPHSSITLTVFVLPYEDIYATFKVKVEEMEYILEEEGPGNYVVNPDGFHSYVILNPDPINTQTIPVLDEYHTPTIISDDPSIDIFFDPTVLSEEIAHLPELPGLLSLANPDIVTPSIRSPSIRSYNVLNPSIRSPSIRSIPEGTVTDIQWNVKNDGNTTSAFSFVPIGEIPPTIEDPNLDQIQYQLLIYRVTSTPFSEDCDLTDEEHHDLILKIDNPSIRSPSIRSPSIRSPSIRSPSIRSNTFFLAPGEEAVCTLRVIDP
ncbi:MAG: sialidase family protein, partial [Candidatus Aminicenantes bacterium]